jgi:hypothetical protein
MKWIAYLMCACFALPVVLTVIGMTFGSAFNCSSFDAADCAGVVATTIRALTGYGMLVGLFSFPLGLLLLLSLGIGKVIDAVRK